MGLSEAMLETGVASPPLLHPHWLLAVFHH